MQLLQEKILWVLGIYKSCKCFFNLQESKNRMEQKEDTLLLNFYTYHLHTTNCNWYVLCMQKYLSDSESAWFFSSFCLCLWKEAELLASACYHYMRCGQDWAVQRCQEPDRVCDHFHVWAPFLVRGLYIPPEPAGTWDGDTAADLQLQTCNVTKKYVFAVGAWDFQFVPASRLTRAVSKHTHTKSYV